MISGLAVTMIIAALTGVFTFVAIHLIADVSIKYFARQRLAARLAKVVQSKQISDDEESPKGWQMPISHWLNTGSGNKFSLLVTQARLDVKPLTAASNLALIMFLSLTVGLFITGSLVSSIILAAGIYFIAVVWLRQRRVKYEQRFVDQLPQALDLMANALSSSSSLVQSIEHAVRESRPPIKNELLMVVEHLGVGMNLDQALDQLYQRLPVPEMEILISALIIQRRVGGNLSKLLARTSELLREKIELKNELMVQTAQSRMSGKVIGLMPLVVVGFLMLIDREFIAPLFTTSLGLVILTFAGLAELAGFLLIRKVLDIEF